ncbi:MAG TPA: hypothetical protein VFK16_10155 [Gemmatimonadaceae bacterium]|jgi:hypothetical protein|nr:hypothetical protein [Gemmatimonadaceae bacterium]
MKADEQDPRPAEPVGIVISTGWAEERPSVYRAYVWGPAPEPGKGKSAAA